MSQDIALKTNNYFSRSQVTELLLGLALFHGFSKMLIALGREPSDMDTVVIPTPTAPTGIPNGITEWHHQQLCASPPASPTA